MSIVMFRLLDRKVDENSHFVNEDGTIDATKKINFNHRYGVLNPYYILDKDQNRLWKRYIRGCNYTDMEKQVKNGIFPDIVNSIVDFKAGGDIIIETKEDAIFDEWLSEHPNNVDSIYHNPDKHDRQFFKYDPHKEVDRQAGIADQEDLAVAMLLQLKADPERLLAIANLFTETNGLSDMKEVYLRLRTLAKEKPAQFMASIADRSKDVHGDIMVALKLGVIAKDAKGYYWVETNARILEIPKAKAAEAEKTLTEYLISRDGEIPYKQLLIKKKQAEIGLEAPAGIMEEEEEKK